MNFFAQINEVWIHFLYRITLIAYFWSLALYIYHDRSIFFYKNNQHSIFFSFSCLNMSIATFKIHFIYFAWVLYSISLVVVVVVKNIQLTYLKKENCEYKIFSLGFNFLKVFSILLELKRYIYIYLLSFHRHS